MKFKHGDRVKMKLTSMRDSDIGIYVHGMVTIINVEDKTCKVLFDEEWAPDYWYYPESDLELDTEYKK